MSIPIRKSLLRLWAPAAVGPLLLLGARPLPAAAPAEPPLLITEFAAAGGQSVRDEDGETPDWVEIQNRAPNAVNLKGWALSEGSRRVRSWSFPETNLQAGQFLIVFASGKDRSGSKLHANFKLQSEGGTLLLRGPNGEVSGVDKYPPQLPGITFGLAEGAANGSSHSPGAALGGTPASPSPRWSYLARPSPGKSNAPAVQFGPRVEWLRHEPAPGFRADEPVRVSAKVAPVLAPIKEVHLFYRVGFSNETEVAMYDDGQHGDATAGDGIYGSAIPPNAAAAGQMLRYYITASDESGGQSRWPLFADRAGLSAYQGGVALDPSIQTRLPVLHIFRGRTVRPGQRAAKSSCSVYYDGELYDNVTLTAHGQISQSFPKQSYNLRFPNDHLLRWAANEPRVKGITLMSNFADKSKIRNALAYDMIAASGCIGHFAFPVRVQMNGKFYSVAEVIEKGGRHWLERVHLDPEGALYKMYSDLSGRGGGEKKTRKYEDDRDLNTLVRALSEGRSLEERAAFAYRQIDLPQCISYLVAMALISSDDHGHKNYYLYRDSRHSQEWSLFPWDVDLSWGRNWTGEYFNETIYVDNPLDLYRMGRHKTRNALYDLLMQYPEFRQMYLRRLRTVMDELLQPPGTPADQLIIEKRILELINAIDPPEIKPSDADLDRAAWPSWGASSSAREEAQRIISSYLPGRRQFLFKSPKAKLFGEPIPPAQEAEATLGFASIKLEIPAAEQLICLTNRSAAAVDISGWKLKGAGIEYVFRPGTVVPAAKSISVLARIETFRRNPLPRVPLFVQGNWSGTLRGGKEPVQLVNRAEHEMARQEVP